MRRNLTTGQTRHFEQRVLLVILLRSGLVLDVIFFLKLFIENMSTLSFLAVITATNLTDAQLVVDCRDGLVTAVSATALELFQITKEAVDAHDVKIRDLIPQYDQYRQAFRDKDNADFDLVAYSDHFGPRAADQFQSTEDRTDSNRGGTYSLGRRAGFGAANQTSECQSMSERSFASD